MRCSVNPVVGRELSKGWINPKGAEKIKRIMVAGGGPGGMEAARVAAMRGHSVTLYEKEEELGGQLRIASLTPGKSKLEFIREYYSIQLRKVGVSLELGVEVEEKHIQYVKPDVLIIATGAEQIVPDIPGISGNNVFMSWDVLSKKIDVPAGTVVVAGGGMVGCEAALYLAEEGKKVTIVEMMSELALDMEPITRFDMLTNQMPEAGVDTMTGTVITEISEVGTVVTDAQGRKSLVKAESVVIALGSRSVNTIGEKAKEIVFEIYVIGDSKNPRQIIDSIYEGARVGRLV